MNYKHISESFHKNFSIASFNYFQCLIALLLDGILNVILSRYLTIDDFANISLALRLINILSFTILLGTGDASAKSFREMIVKHKKQDIGRYISWNLNYIFKTLTASIIIAFILFFTLDPLNIFSWGFDEFYIEFLPFVFFTAPFAALIRLYSCFTKCYKQLKFSRFLESMAFSLTTIVFLLVEYEIYKIDPTNEFFTIRLLFRSYLVIFFFTTLYIAICVPEIFSKIKEGINKQKIRYKWVCDAKLHAKNLLVFNINSNISVILVGLFAFDTKSLAFYNISLLIAKFIKRIPNAIFMDLVPDINSAMKNQQTQQEFSKRWQQCNALNIICICIMSTIIFFFNEQILSIFGTGYITKDAIIILNIILLGEGLSCLFGYNQLLLCFTDYINVLTKTDIISLFIQVIISVPLFLMFGVIGIAIAFSISGIINELMVLYATKKVIPFNLYFPEKNQSAFSKTN